MKCLLPDRQPLVKGSEPHGVGERGADSWGRGASGQPGASPVWSGDENTGAGHAERNETDQGVCGTFSFSQSLFKCVLLK